MKKKFSLSFLFLFVCLLYHGFSSTESHLDPRYDAGFGFDPGDINGKRIALLAPILNTDPQWQAGRQKQTYSSLKEVRTILICLYDTTFLQEKQKNPQLRHEYSHLHLDKVSKRNSLIPYFHTEKNGGSIGRIFSYELDVITTGSQLDLLQKQGARGWEIFFTEDFYEGGWWRHHLVQSQSFHLILPFNQNDFFFYKDQLSSQGDAFWSEYW